MSDLAAEELISTFNAEPEAVREAARVVVDTLFRITRRVSNRYLRINAAAYQRSKDRSARVSLFVPTSRGVQLTLREPVELHPRYERRLLAWTVVRVRLPYGGFQVDATKLKLVAAALRKRGYEVSPVQMPECELEEDVAA